MRTIQTGTTVCLLGIVLSGFSPARGEDSQAFGEFLRPLLKQKCVACHGGEKTNAEINFQKLKSGQSLLKQPELIENMFEVIDGNVMPPDGAPQVDKADRKRLLATLKRMLRQATADSTNRPLQIRRLNRFQYNYSVKDLFGLKLDVFPLPEKLMTRHGNYLNTTSDQAPKAMPKNVEVSSLALNPKPGLRNVKAFPKDLRAAHGFDNQANQLTLSPLLLDAYLRLSVSIVESPDFTQANVGIWNDFFAPPAETDDLGETIRTRLRPFLRVAFRGRLQETTLDRYVAYAEANIKAGSTFTESMKKVASAALSSPLFLLRAETTEQPDAQFQLASRLSYMLWSSGPDLELLDLAENGQLAHAQSLRRTIDRMLADPKIERFLDSFPAQWMQLENILAATPDPAKNKFFSIDKNHPASLQMVLEPLLLFDAVFVEDRSIVELIAPTFAYQSEFLKTWYFSDLVAPRIDAASITAENERNDEKSQKLQATIDHAKRELDELLKPIKAKVLAARGEDHQEKTPDLKPFAAWEFDGDLKDSIGDLHLAPNGEVKHQDGAVFMHRSYLISKPLPIQLKAKTLEVWCQVPNLNQRGGGVMGIQGPGDFFDTIVLGERKPKHWISGSNGFSRTLDFPESTEENISDQWLHLTMVYEDDGQTRLYRNGIPYGKPYRKGKAAFPAKKCRVIFGLRHLPAGGNKYLSVLIDRARLYNRALTAEEVAASARGDNYVSQKELLAAMNAEQKSSWATLTQQLTASNRLLTALPPRKDLVKLQQAENQRYENKIRQQMRSRTFQRVPAADPRYGGVVTNAAMLSMTSGPKRTHPIARGAWIIEVIFNDPPPPPPNDVPPLNEEQTSKKLTIREKFAKHRENPDCAGCHSRLDPLGFALENFDITGRWRDKYGNGRKVDSSGMLLKKHDFQGIEDFKKSLVKEERRFAKAFTAHLLRYALSRELQPADSLTIDAILRKTQDDRFRLKSMIREVILSQAFTPVSNDMQR